VERFSKIVHHPAVTLGSLIIGILGFVVGYKAIERPKLCWSAGARQSIVSPRDERSQLSVLYKGARVTNDITAMQIAIWNEGSKSIKRSDILSPIQSMFVRGIPILEARLLKMTRSLINPSISTNEWAAGKISVAWDILESGDGFVVQMIVAGDDTVIETTGAIEHQKKPVWKESKGPPKVPLVILSAILLCFAGFFLITSIQKWRAAQNRRWSPDLVVTCLLFGVLALSSVTTLWNYFFATRPPFLL
jgi:hypothetical protein